MRSAPSRSARSQKTQHTFAAIIPVAIILLSVTGFVWAQKQATVVIDGRALHVDSQAADVAALLQQADVAVGSGDIVTPPPETRVTGGMTVVVRHAIPVTVRLGGTETELKVVGETVADALVAAGVDPSAHPAVNPALDVPLKPGMVISEPERFSRISTHSESVPFVVVERADPTWPRGSRRVVVPGSNGVVLRVFRSPVVGGVEGTPTLCAEKVVAKPVNQVVCVGTGGPGAGQRQIKVARLRGALRASAVAGRAPRSGRKIRVVATAYSAAEPGAAPNTATGHPCERGVIAVDPRIIPLRTRVYVPGYGYAIAYDTGSAIKGNRIDLCFNTAAECEAWGRRPVTIIILD